MKKKKRSYYEQRVSVEHRIPHRSPNPICARCGWRTYPRWGPHVCHRRGDPISNTDLKEAARWAGHVISNLYFYRVSAHLQAEATAIALGYILGRNTNGPRGARKLAAAVPALTRLILAQGGLNPATSVQALGRRYCEHRLKARRVTR